MRKLRCAEHVSFASNVRSIIETAGTEALGLSDLVFDPFAAAIALEQDAVNKTTASLITPEMEGTNKQRLLVFRRIRRKMQVAEVEDQDTTQFKAYPLIKKCMLDQYKGTVTSLPYQECTATIAGFVMDARQLLEPEVIEALGIDSDLDDLQANNRKFSKAYQQRVAERAQTTVITSDLRAATDAAYAALVIVLNSLANDPTPANKTKTEAAQQVVAQINVLINEARSRVNQRLGKKGDANGSDESGTSGSGSGSNTGSNGTGTQKPVTPPADDDVME